MVAVMAGTGAPVTLTADSTGGTFGPAFTTDGSRALYVTGGDDEWVGDLHSQAASGGAVADHGKRVWRWRAAGGSTVVFNDQYTAVAKHAGRADLRVAHVGTGDSSQRIATQADANFFVDGQSVVYTMSGGASDGLYVAGW